MAALNKNRLAVVVALLSVSLYTCFLYAESGPHVLQHTGLKSVHYP